MSKRFLALAPLVVGILLIACTAREQVRNELQDEQVPELPQTAPLPRYEATFNPSDYDEEIHEAQRPHKPEGRKASNEVVQDSIVVESELMQGFRIQIFASPDIDEANAMRITAMQRMVEDSVYVVFDPPLYKVRLGDFPTRIEANRRLASLVERGFPDAWVVSDQIVLRRFIRIQSPEAPQERD